jgi:hypothetical protein
MIKRSLAMVLPLALLIGACAGQGAGTLEAVIDPGGETYGHTSFATGRDKGFGVFVCSRNGEVELESIEPMHSEGSIEFLGALVYTSEDKFVGAAHGFPPDGLDVNKTEPLEGAVVDSACAEPSSSERVQILVGAERTSSAGGVLDGFVVTTDNGDLEISLTVLLCGDEMEFCEALIPEDDG